MGFSGSQAKHLTVGEEVFRDSPQGVVASGVGFKQRRELAGLVSRTEPLLAEEGESEAGAGGGAGSQGFAGSPEGPRSDLCFIRITISERESRISVSSPDQLSCP